MKKTKAWVDYKLNLRAYCLSIVPYQELRIRGKETDRVVSADIIYLKVTMDKESEGQSSEKTLACYRWSLGFDQESFKLGWQCHQLLSVFLANGHLPRVSRQSVNNAGNENIPEAV